MNLILPAHADTRPIPEIFQTALHIFRGRFYDKRGAKMWAEINRLLVKLDRRSA